MPCANFYAKLLSRPNKTIKVNTKVSYQSSRGEQIFAAFHLALFVRFDTISFSPWIRLFLPRYDRHCNSDLETRLKLPSFLARQSIDTRKSEGYHHVYLEKKLLGKKIILVFIEFDEVIEISI